MTNKLQFGDERALEILRLEREKCFIKYEAVGDGKKLEKCPRCDNVNNDQFVLCYRFNGVSVFNCSDCGDSYKALKPNKA